MGIMESIMDQSGGKWVKFDTPGQTLTGVVASISERQVTDFTTKLPATWADGNPKMEVVVVLQTTERDDPDDDGKRTISIKGWGQQRGALHEACVKLGRALEVGDSFHVRMLEAHTSKGGTGKSDVFTYAIKAAEAPF